MTGPGADWLAITALKARYCRCLDTKDWDGFGAVFVDDVVIDTTGSGGPLLEGRDAALAFIRRSLEAAVTVHQVHAPEIAIDTGGDRATGVWAMHDEVTWPGGRSLTGDGHYHETYARSGDGWRIAASRLIRLRVVMREEGEA